MTVDCAAVDFDLSADQQALRDAAAALLDGWPDTTRSRARVGTGAVVGTLPGAGEAVGDRRRPGDARTHRRATTPAVWSAMADQGWLAIELPEDEGGLGLGMVEVAVLCEEIGRRLVAAPFLPSILALGALSGPEARADAGTKEWREALGEGAAVGCVAFAPGADHGDAVGGRRARCASAARRRRPPTRPRPTWPWSSPAAASTASTCAARGGPTPCPPWTARASSASWPSTARRPGTSAAPTRRRCCSTAPPRSPARRCSGAADRVLSMTVEYAKDRVQFGKPIGSFQAVKHMLADALVDVEGMRSTVYYAAWCAAAGDPDRSLAASMAKAWCSDASRRVMAAGLQVHGGIGFTWEHDMHLYVKRAQLDQVSYGDAAFHRDRIAAMLRERLDVGRGALLTRPGREPRAPTARRVRSGAVDPEQHQRLAFDAVRRLAAVASFCGGTTTVRRTPTR